MKNDRTWEWCSEEVQERERERKRDRKQDELVRKLQVGLWAALILAQMTVVNVLTVRADTLWTERELAEAQSAEAQPAERGALANRVHPVERQVTYRMIEGASRLPETLEVTVEDGVHSAAAVCEAVETEVTGEEWLDDFSFPVTFHAYGADYYRIRDQLVPVMDAAGPVGAPGPGEAPYPGETGNDGDEPGRQEIALSDDIRVYLLELIGVSQEEYEITGLFWDGEAYTDENGVLCRDAEGIGRRLVRDYRVRYVGSVQLPDSGLNRNAEESQPQTDAVETEEVVETETAGMQREEAPVVQIEPEEEPELQEKPLTLWQKISRLMLAAVGIGVVLFFGGLLLLGILRVVKWARKWYSYNNHGNRKKE